MTINHHQGPNPIKVPTGRNLWNLSLNTFLSLPVFASTSTLRYHSWQGRLLQPNLAAMSGLENHVVNRPYDLCQEESTLGRATLIEGTWLMSLLTFVPPWSIGPLVKKTVGLPPICTSSEANASSVRKQTTSGLRDCCSILNWTQPSRMN